MRNIFNSQKIAVIILLLLLLLMMMMIIILMLHISGTKYARHNKNISVCGSLLFLQSN